MMAKKHLLSVCGVGVRYSNEAQWAIRGIDLEIQAGEIVSLIGPNGAGKSTLLRVMAGLWPATEGRIQYAGHTPIRLGYVPQQPPLDRSLPISVEEFLQLKLPGQGWNWRSAAFASTKIEARLRESGLAHLRQRKLGLLSGGQLQRVMMAYGLLDDPEILLLDEPLTGVDVQGGEDFRTLVRSLRDQKNLAIVMVSHDLHVVGAVSDRVVCLNRSMCCSGTPQHMLQEHVLSGIFGTPLLGGLVIPEAAVEPMHHHGLDCCGGHHG